MAISPGSHKDKTLCLHGWPCSPGTAKWLSRPLGDTAGTGTQLVQSNTACMGTDPVQVSIANVGPHGRYRELQAVQGHTARMETADMQPGWGPYQCWNTAQGMKTHGHCGDMQPG